MDAMRKYGTTEKDMPFSHIRNLLAQAGFSEIDQFVRLMQLPMNDVSKPDGAAKQGEMFKGLMFETTQNGLTSLVVAKKPVRNQ